MSGPQMSDGYVLLVTDRIDAGEAVAQALGIAMDVRITGPGMPGITDFTGVQGVVTDINLNQTDSVRHLRATLGHKRATGTPLMCMLRNDSEQTFLQARAHGANLCVAASTPPRSLAVAVVNNAFPGESIVERVVNRGLMKSGAAVGTILRAVDNGGRIDMPKVTDGVDPVINAIKMGGLARWLDGVWVHDDVTYAHCLMVAGLAAAIALDLGFPHADQHRFIKAALMHDLGKARIPHAILNKPGKLTDSERDVMRTHALLGHEILVNGGITDHLTLDVALHHHEMIDGSGYPDRLRGDGISDPVRLMTICDIYAALVEKRPYKEAMSPSEAFCTLAKMGDKLEQSMVEALARAVLKPALAAAA